TVMLDNSPNIVQDEMRDFYAFLDDEANAKKNLNELEQFLADPLFSCPHSGKFDVLA
ncbi:1829_t:CDS:1, partial [Racocetra fulgida]